MGPKVRLASEKGKDVLLEKKAAKALKTLDELMGALDSATLVISGSDKLLAIKASKWQKWVDARASLKDKA